MKKLSLLPIFLLLLVAGATAQTGKSIDAIKSEIKTLKANKRVKVAYDKFTDRSAIATAPFNLISGKEAFGLTFVDALSRGPYGSGAGVRGSLALMLNVFAYFPQQEITKDIDEFTVLLTSGGSNWTFLKGDNTLYMIADEERLQFEAADKDNDVDGRHVTEQIAYVIGRNDLEKIANAKSLEIRIGMNTPARKIKPELQDRMKAILQISKIPQ